MAEIKISELPEAVALGDNEVFPIVQAGITKKAIIKIIIDKIIQLIDEQIDFDSLATKEWVIEQITSVDFIDNLNTIQNLTPNSIFPVANTVNENMSKVTLEALAIAIGAYGTSGIGGVIPDETFVPPADPGGSLIYFAGPGTYPNFPIEGGAPMVLTEELNVVSWDGDVATVLPVPIQVLQDTDLVEFAIVDEFDNALLWIDLEGITHCKLSKDSLPEDLTQQAAGSLKMMQHEYQAYQVSKNGQPGSAANEPISVMDTEGSIWIATVGDHAELYITKITNDGRLIKRKIANTRSLIGDDVTDSHNNPTILLDNRPGAPYPIMVFQAEHNTAPLRYWRFTTLDITQWDVNTWTETGGNCAYSLSYRYNDEIYIISRNASGVRPWKIAYSANNGDTWTHRNIFITAGSWLYAKAKEKEDGSGVNMMWYGHAQESPNQNVYFLNWDYESGEITRPDEIIPVIPDLRAAIANPAFDPIDPLSNALLLYTADTGIVEKTNGQDITKSVSGECVVLFAVTTTTTSEQKVVSFNLETGDINHTTILVSREMIDQTTGQTCLMSNTLAIIGGFAEIAKLNIGTLSELHYGNADLSAYDFTDPATIVVSRIIEGNFKAEKCYKIGNTNKMIYSEARFFNSWDSYYTDTILHDFDEINY